MESDSTPHHRRSIRLRSYEYSLPGVYFVTICTQGRRLLFGEIGEGQMYLNDVGKMIVRWWRELTNKFPVVRLDASVVMPNHLHGLLIISNVPVGADLRVRPQPVLGRAELPSLAHVLRWFKTMTTNEYLRRIKGDRWPPLDGKLWQRNYYEHIVRRSRSVDRIRQYIVENPLGWQSDVENPADTGGAPDEIGDIIREDLYPFEQTRNGRSRSDG